MSLVEDRDDEYGEEEEDRREREEQQKVVIVEPIIHDDQEVGISHNMIPPPFPFPSPSYHQLLAPAGDIRDPSRSSPAAAAAAAAVAVQKEHMFDKVVTPSDVGKLNRLVIPKQHAEKYFPLDSSANEKGLLLSFEDCGGKQWRFRYSYWNSSQSYVMTKGWSRFVKDKKLDAGDIVTFERGLGLDNDRLFIDWKRRPSLNPPSRGLPVLPQHRQAPWGRVFFPTMSPAIAHLHHVHPQLNYGYGAAVVAPQGSLYNLRMPGAAPAGGGGGGVPMVFESVPVAHTAAVSTAGKRPFRLFGVNLDCPDQESNERRQAGLELELYNAGETPTPSSSSSAREVPRKEKQSLSLDLDI